jgi:signal transduction histidine kinase
MLYEFVLTHRDEIVARARLLVQARSAPRPLSPEIEEGVPLFLSHLAESLRARGERSVEQEHIRKETAARHGSELLRQGFTVAQVVHDYGAVCQAVTDLAAGCLEPIAAEEFAALNLYLDEAIADAVTEFLRVRELVLAKEERDRLGVFGHEMRNLISTAMISFEMIQSGTVPLRGSSATMHARALRALQVLTDRSLSEIRISAGTVRLERLHLAELVEEIEITALVDAQNRSLDLTVEKVPRELVVNADRHLLASAITNLLQNAFKFSAPGGHVRLRVAALAESPALLRIEVEDQCGGLPSGNPEELFRLYEQRGVNRSGMGLGLAISRKAVEANGGRLSMRDLPGHGCVFTVDLPTAAAIPS